MRFSRESLDLFAFLVSQQKIPVGVPNLVEVAQQFTTAQAELQAALDELGGVPPLLEPSVDGDDPARNGAESADEHKSNGQPPAPHGGSVPVA